MATHSSILAWRIPWTEEPDTLSLGLRRPLDAAEAWVSSELPWGRALAAAGLGGPARGLSPLGGSCH